MPDNEIRDGGVMGVKNHAQEQTGSEQCGDLTQEIPFETALKLLEALYIRAEGSLGAREDLDKIKELLLT